MPRRSQEDRSRATKSELIRTGRDLFAEHGYANVSAEQIVAAAGVTRGALYHHFGDKLGLFTAVFDEVESETTGEIAAVAGDAPDPITGMLASLGAFLDMCQRPDVVRITMIDAPAVLGWEVFRAMEAKHGLGLITGVLQSAADAGLIAQAPIPVLGQLVFTTVIEAGLLVAHAEDAAAARADAERALMLMFAGILNPAG
jgi:AcrR family transcriptional regulator